ncbi:hypothetical protein IC229_34720 [Spirosoma sp. BT702]|uniref:Uncharacterized protein n=1 Tax=Spirosoma profusum TaxID=2771354 RepID=A0A927GB97_9BACT|nr:hypothetical protein [Spirosoma profusum]MBD2705805.1 hypothetical protein [Spirosoma profusum]
MADFTTEEIPDLIDRLDWFANYLIKTIHDSTNPLEQIKLRAISYETSALLLSLESLQE